MKPVSPDHVRLGAAIREVRTERSLSQVQLGEASGLDRTYIGGVERGERNPTFGSLIKIADALGVKVSELVLRGEQ